MTSNRRAFFAALSGVLLFCSLPARAQRTYEAGKIVFTDKGEYTQAELEEAMGLHVGSKFKQDDLNAAAQRLSDTGYFDSVGGSLAGMSDKVDVTIDLKPAAHNELLHAGFENFVWLSRDEIAAAIHGKVPLYRGYLPETGTQADLANDALTQALAAKGIAARVQHFTVEPSLEHPERVAEFRIARPSIRVANVHLSGVSKDLVPYLQKSVNAASRTGYNEGLAGEQTATTILAPLLDAGYADATLSGLSLEPTTAADGSVGVVVTVALSAGDVYRVGTLTFAGTPLMTAEAFAATQKLHTGDVASRKSLIETLAPLDAAYRRKGYMDVVASATPTLDKTAHTVDYAVTVVPGEPYHVHEVTTRGLEGDAKAKADYDRGFLMKPGDVYNPEYLMGFLKNNSALQALNGYAAGFKASADPASHTVDVLITFYKGAAR